MYLPIADLTFSLLRFSRTNLLVDRVEHTGEEVGYKQAEGDDKRCAEHAPCIQVMMLIVGVLYQLKYHVERRKRGGDEQQKLLDECEGVCDDGSEDSALHHHLEADRERTVQHSERQSHGKVLARRGEVIFILVEHYGYCE